MDRARTLSAGCLTRRFCAWVLGSSSGSAGRRIGYKLSGAIQTFARY